MKNNIKIERFCIEIDNFIDGFEGMIKTLNYDTELKVFVRACLDKIISNVRSANLLISKQNLNEAKIVLRSSIETVILITYLGVFP